MPPDFLRGDRSSQEGREVEEERTEQMEMENDLNRSLEILEKVLGNI